MVLEIFKIVLCVRNRHVFLWQSLEVLSIFNILALKEILWKMKTFFKKLENFFLVESTQTENASFPNKTALSEGSVNENRMVDAKWTRHKERSFASDYLIFKKILFPHKSFL